MTHVDRLSRVLPRVEIKKIPDANHATTPAHPKFAETILALLKQKNSEAKQ